MGEVGGDVTQAAKAAMRLRLRDGDHRSVRNASSQPSTHCCNAAPSQGRRSRAMRRRRCRSATGCNAAPSQGRRSPRPPMPRGRARGCCNAAPSQGRRSRPDRAREDAERHGAAMRLRLRDGDHQPSHESIRVGWLAAMRLRLRDGDHGLVLVRRDVCAAAAAMRLRLRDGDHLFVRAGARNALCQLQCGSVSGTEITGVPLTYRGTWDAATLQCGSVSGTEITTPAIQAGQRASETRCNAAPSQGRRSRAGRG